MHIGILCHASYGGSTQVAVGIANELCRRGHAVYLFAQAAPFDGRRCANGVEVCTPSPVPEATAARSPCSLHISWSGVERARYLHRLLRAVAAERLDVIHFHYAIPFAFLVLELRRRMGRRAPSLCGTLHGTDVSVHGRVPRRRARLEAALKRLDAITTVSQSHARLAQATFRLAAPPQVISNFVDPSRFRPASPAVGARRYRRRPRLVHVSNFRLVKRATDVARIFIRVRRIMDAELWLIGDGEQMPEVVKLLWTAGVAGDVRYFGLRHDVGAIVARADLMLVTSEEESFCLAALEAMACGVPVLATHVGGIPEIIEDGETGFLYPLGRVEEAVDLARIILGDPHRHRAMSEAAIRRAAQFGVAEVVSAYERLYLRLQRAAARSAFP